MAIDGEPGTPKAAVALGFHPKLGRATEVVRRVLLRLQNSSTTANNPWQLIILHTPTFDTPGKRTGLDTVLDLGKGALKAHRHVIDKVQVPSIGIRVFGVGFGELRFSREEGGLNLVEGTVEFFLGRRDREVGLSLR